MKPGDPEVLVVAALKGRAAVNTPAGGRIGTLWASTFPAIRVTLVAGASRPTQNTGSPLVQVECAGNGSGTAAQAEASSLAREVEDAAWDLAGAYSSGRIVTSWVEGNIIHSPLADTGRECYIVQIGLLTQP